MAQAPRDLLRAMFDAAVAAALPAGRVPAFLPARPKGRTVVVGAGKASAAMAKAVEDHWGGPLGGLVVTRYGVDGAEEVAGAIAAPDTLARAAALGVRARDSLERNDGHGFFAAFDGQVVTGPTLTNVNDFRAVLVTKAAGGAAARTAAGG